MKKSLNLGLSIFLLTFHLQAQYITDTLYSGRSTSVDFSMSITEKLNSILNDIKLCDKQPKHLEDDPKAFVPFLLNYYSNKKLKNKNLLDFDALIYTNFCTQNDIFNETFFLEFFYQNEKKAKECIKSLDRLVKIFEYENRHDIMENKNEMVGSIGVYNWFYILKENVVYFVHRRIPDSVDFPTTLILKNKIIEILDNK